MRPFARILQNNSRLILFAFCLLLPFILSPLVISPHKESKCAYVIILIATYWLLEPVPIAVTALLPVVLLPVFGLVNSSEVAVNYMKESFMMFIGGLIVAIAVEDCKLHERIALKVLLLIGTEIKWLMMGFMMTTMLLSMWISNTATTAMMIPIAEAVIEEMSLDSDGKINHTSILMDEINSDSLLESKDNDVKVETLPRKNSREETAPRRRSSIKTGLLLCICYSANIGGTGTLTGTGPNLVLKVFLEDSFPESDEITFSTWMMYNVPGMVLCVLIAWFYLYLVYIRCSKDGNQRRSSDCIREIIKKRYKNLGPIRFHEAAVVVLFLLLVLLWIFRDPKFISGWTSLFPSETKIGDSVPAIAVAFLLFLVPSDPKRFSSSPPILEWKTAQTKLPWGVILLIGGGYSLADAAEKSGLSMLVGNKLSSLAVLSPGAIVVIVCFMTATITEVMTNTTTANILLPVICQMAVSIGVNPLFLLLPVTVTCSYAFMLPVATVPNAIAFASGQMRTAEMAKPGFAMNIACCCVQLLMLNTLGVAMFNLNQLPSWANNTSASDGMRASFPVSGIHSSFLTNTSSVSLDANRL